MDMFSGSTSLQFHQLSNSMISSITQILYLEPVVENLNLDVGLWIIFWIDRDGGVTLHHADIYKHMTVTNSVHCLIDALFQLVSHMLI